MTTEGSTQRQTVVVTRLADRHASDDRDYAEAKEVVVPAGALTSVLVAVACLVDGGVGRYTLTVSEPWDIDPPALDGGTR